MENGIKFYKIGFTRAGFEVTEDEYWGFNNVAVEPYIAYNPDNWTDIPYYKEKEFQKIKNHLINIWNNNL